MRKDRQIRAREVRVIDDQGQMLGILATPVAQRLALEKNLNLVEVNPNETPPICRMLDYGKYIYEQEKKSKSKPKGGPARTKEVQFHPSVGEHDLKVKLSHVREFLISGYKVHVIVRFRGREMVHQEIGRKLIERALGSVIDIAQSDEPINEGRNLTVWLNPKPHSNGKKLEPSPSLSL